MAVCRQDMLYKDNTSNPIPTYFIYLKSFCELCYKITGKSNFFWAKKDVGMGLRCLCITCLARSFCGFWHHHPYIPLHWRITGIRKLEISFDNILLPIAICCMHASMPPKRTSRGLREYPPELQERVKIGSADEEALSPPGSARVDCGFWHGHPYIPLHCFKMLVASFFAH